MRGHFCDIGIYFNAQFMPVHSDIQSSIRRFQHISIPKISSIPNILNTRLEGNYLRNIRHPLFFLSLLLTGACTSNSEALKADAAYCQSIGAIGDKFTECMMYKDQSRRNDRQRRSEALIAAGAQLNQMAQPPAYARPVIPTQTQCFRQYNGVVTCRTM